MRKKHIITLIKILKTLLKLPKTWDKSSILDTHHITNSLLAFNQKRKANDGTSHGEGLVAKGNQERERNKPRGE